MLNFNIFSRIFHQNDVIIGPQVMKYAVPELDEPDSPQLLKYAIPYEPDIEPEIEILKYAVPNLPDEPDVMVQKYAVPNLPDEPDVMVQKYAVPNLPDEQNVKEKTNSPSFNIFNLNEYIDNLFKNIFNR